MSTQENKALVRRFFEETWVKGNAAAVNEFMAADYVEHPRHSSLSPGPEGLKQLIDAYRTAFPDLDHKILTSSIGHYDRCCTGHHS